MTREDLSAWIDENAPRELWGTASTPFQGHWGGTKVGFPSEAHRVWYERCIVKGWTAPTWPKQYGGGGESVEWHRMWREELIARGMPLPLVGIGLTMIGPILMQEGTDAQKAEHLPGIIDGSQRWAQGYSEPEAGSDLASLQCKAEVTEGGYRITGQKTWTSHADLSDWIFCLVRTSEDKHTGITFVLFRLDQPGITVRPIELISGASPFCEVFFDSVFVADRNVIGQVGDGWRVAKALLRHERGMVGESIAAGGARLPELQRWTLRKAFLESGDEDPLLRDAVARSEMDQEAMRLTVKRSNDKLKAGSKPGAESSIFKLFGTELNQRRWELGVQITGSEALLWEHPLGRQWLRSRGNSIEGGTSEVQRNIVARRVLGLPKP